MKVYTHYYKAKDAENTEFRWRTLLQFGSSWDIIGSVVMKNPGSSEPKVKGANGDAISISDKNILSKLGEFDDSKNKWYEFVVGKDSTMKRIKKLFEYYYDSENLQGVIQIFNIFYIKDAKLKSAIEKDKKFPFNDESDILKYDIENLKMPIYLGFGNLRNKSKYRKACQEFFEAAKKLGMKYCAEEYDENKFTHPLASVKFGKNKSEFKNSLQDFINSRETV